ncbi:phage terminase small subunit P27 family [Paracoccus sp. TK19116]|uniref:Phage terminase small subunit P27 family n=2 Tax=Paracoccus albicereus TaxID=2922394 RepID=A0ABT1MV58_9RHOB|nr:phage terminase small subunit P27 family [Paracoccus albicereus]
MRTGRKPIPRKPTLTRTRLNALPRCPSHLSHVAQKEWRRLATPLHEAGILTLADRSALAAYCQAYGRWAEAETKLAETPALLKTPSGYVQQSPWLSVANKQMELMGRFMAELGLTPVARARLSIELPETVTFPTMIQLVPYEGKTRTEAKDEGPRDRAGEAETKPDGITARRPIN